MVAPLTQFAPWGKTGPAAPLQGRRRPALHDGSAGKGFGWHEVPRHRKALGTGHAAGFASVSKVASQSKLRARQPTPMPSAAPSQRSAPALGHGSRQPTARGVGSQDPNREKWDIDTHRTTYRAPSTQRSFPPDTPLGDQGGSNSSALVERFRREGPRLWQRRLDVVPISAIRSTGWTALVWFSPQRRFEQYGFRGWASIPSASGAAGVPSWSPYYRTWGPVVRRWLLSA